MPNEIPTQTTATRETFLRAAVAAYNLAPESLWAKSPNHLVLRRPDNRKWFAVLLEVPRAALGLAGEGRADLLNLKCGDPLLRDLLLARPGYRPAYHMNRANWIGLLLDGSLPLAEAMSMLQKSYNAAGGKTARRVADGPIDWLVPSNLQLFDVIAEFAETDTILWTQSSHIRPGDTVYIYCGAPVKAILFRCTALETDLPGSGTVGGRPIKKLMRIRLQRRYAPEQFPLARLQREFGVQGVRGPRTVPHRLAHALREGA